ncbi:MAG: glycosyltransferase family 1 protein, partial [Chloroflexi bacterium]|nr:glycosyltransferase family 1 protein [Chloroflexota bacterium]
MKIALVEDYAAEGWPSMALYAEQLAVHLAALPSPRSPVEIVRVQPRRPLPRLAGRVGNWITLLSRWTVYQAIARRVRADVYHVLDHSYANLI